MAHRVRLHPLQLPDYDGKDMTMRALIALIVAAMLGFVGGCNTIEGMGKDVKATGQAIEQSADENRRY